MSSHDPWVVCCLSVGLYQGRDLSNVNLREGLVTGKTNRWRPGETESPMYGHDFMVDCPSTGPKMAQTYHVIHRHPVPVETCCVRMKDLNNTTLSNRWDS